MFHRIHKIILKIFGHLCSQWICIDAPTDLELRAQGSWKKYWVLDKNCDIGLLNFLSNGMMHFCKKEKLSPYSIDLFDAKKECKVSFC